MMDQRLLDYIGRELKRGCLKEDIVKALIESGYDAEVVKEHFSYIRPKSRAKTYILSGVLVLFSAVIILLTVFFVLQDEAELKVEETYESIGWQLYRQGRYDEAIAEFNTYIEENPQNAIAHSGLGWSFYKKEDYQSSLNSFKTSVELYSKDRNSQNGLGWANFELKNYEDAIDSFERAIKIDPNHHDPYRGLGWSYYRPFSDKGPWSFDSQEWLDNFEKSISYFNKAIELEPNDISAYTGLGYSYQQKGYLSESYLDDYSKSQAAFQKSLELSQDNNVNEYLDRIYSGLAWSDYFLNRRKPENDKNYSKTLDLFENSLEFDSEDWLAHRGLGLTYQKVQNYDKSIFHLEKAAKLNPDRTSILVNIGHSYYKKQQANNNLYSSGGTSNYDKAKEYFKKAIEKDPNYFDGYTGLGMVSLRQRNYDDALSYLNKALELPNINYQKNNNLFADAYIGKAIVYRRLGQYELSLENYDRAIEIDPNEDAIYSGRGGAYLKMGEYDLAIDDYNKAFELNKFNWRSPRGLGWVKYAEGNFDKSLKLFESALEINPRDDNSYEGLGRAYYKLGNFDMAIESFEKAIELNPLRSSNNLAFDGLGWAYLRKNDNNNALTAFEKSVENRPNTVMSYIGMAVIYINQNDNSNSEVMIKKALDSNGVGAQKPEFHNKFFVECMDKLNNIYSPANIVSCIESGL